MGHTGGLPLINQISHWVTFCLSVNYGPEPKKCRAQLRQQRWYLDEADGGGLHLDDWNNQTELPENRLSKSA